MASGDDELDKIIKVLKSLIVPVKGGLPLHQLEREYKLNEGKPIPLSKFGFSNITALVRSIPEIRLSADGILTVQSANLAHLTDLVARQKTSKPKSKRMPRLQTARQTFGARSSHAARSYSAVPVRRPVHQRSFNAPSVQRTYNASSSQRTHISVPPPLAAVAPVINPHKMQARRLSPVKSPRSATAYNTAPRPLPTVLYPGKKAEPVMTEAASKDNQVNGYLSSGLASSSRRQELTASTSSYGLPKPPPTEMSRSKSYPSGNTEPLSHRLATAASSHDTSRTEPISSKAPTSSSRIKHESAAYRLVVAALGRTASRPQSTETEESRNGGGDAQKIATTTALLGSPRGRVPFGRGSACVDQVQPPAAAMFGKSAVIDSNSMSDQLSACFAQMQMYKAQGAAPAAPAAYPSSTPLTATPARFAESAALANQKSFLESVMKEGQRKQAFAQVNAMLQRKASPVEEPAPVLTSWNMASYRPSVPPAPAASGAAYAAPSAPQLSTSFADSYQPTAPPLSPDAPVGAYMTHLQETQHRGAGKSLKPMDRLLPQNLDNAESIRARQTLEQEVDRERQRALGLGGAPSAAPPPRMTSQAPAAPTVPAVPLNVICDWERHSALMMIKPLYQNAQLVGDNLMMQVAKLELNLENHFVRAEGIPYRVGLCVSGLTLAQAAVEVSQQRAIYPKLVVCLGSIDILMNCELSEMCRHMLLFLGSLTQQTLLVQRVYVCSLPPLPTATPMQRETLVEFNRWLAKFCSESRIFFLCNIFDAFLDEDYHIREQLYTPAVRINMGADRIIRLQPWSKQGCQAFLAKLEVILNSN